MNNSNSKSKKVVAILLGVILVIAMMPELAWAEEVISCPSEECSGTLVKHDYTDATCTSAGNINYYQCNADGCGKIYVKTNDEYVEKTADEVSIPMKSHSLKKVAALAASCNTGGHVEYYYCTNCNTKFSDGDGKLTITDSELETTALGHDYQAIEGEEASAATCTKASEQKKACTKCGTTVTVTVSPALGHVFDNGVSVTDSTCTAQGVIKYTCQREGCSHSETRATLATGHSAGTEYLSDSNDHWHLCTKCNAVTNKEAHEGSLNWKSADEETHNRVCSKCGAITKTEVHSWDEGQIIKNATTTTTGLERFSCSVCEATKDVVIPMLTDTGDGNGNQGEGGGNEGEGGSQGGNGGSQGEAGSQENGGGQGSGTGYIYISPVTPVSDTDTDGTTDDDTNPEKIAAQEKIATGVENTQLKGKSAATQGKITLTWQKEKGYKVDGYQIYRSTKKTKGYKKFFTTTKTSYTNTKQLKSGTRYYYKVRGYRQVGDETVYTKWSNLMSKVAV